MVLTDIRGYEGLYQISDVGQVVRNGKSIYVTCHRNGYHSVRLSKNGQVKSHSVHRLVAQAFIPNVFNLPEVNHKDEDKSNNSVDNLEWTDRLSNMRHSVHKHYKPVSQYNMDGEFIRQYESAKSTKEFGYTSTSVTKCCNGLLSHHKQYIWRWTI